ncbi:MAG: DUF4097 family beta strand repeat protein [Alteromonadaceae bacterium]|nr:DUF4097 family beta strand repeat protein [Alteromonadaceae bacterium]
MRISRWMVSLVFVGFAMQSFAGEKINQSLSANGVSNITIENLRGEVTIIGWDKEEVIVKGELDNKARGLIFEQKGSTIAIKVKMPRSSHWGWSDKGSELTIKIPKNLRMKFTGVSSDVSVKNLLKSTEIKTVSGEINATDLNDYIELATVSGSIHSHDLSGKVQLISVSGDIKDVDSTGRLQLKSVSGSIESTSKANEVFANTVSGDIDLNLAGVDELTISTVSGDADSRLFLNENGLVKLSSVSGDLDMYFQADVQASFKLNANAGGDLINKLTSAKAKHAKYGPSAKLYFKTGNANGSVRASTVSGTVKILSK